MKKLLFLIPVLLIGCKTAPGIIDTNGTDSIAVETIVQGKDLENTIDNIKVITDTVKDNGNVITGKETVKIIEYVDRASGQVKELNSKLIDLEKSRKGDNITFLKSVSSLTNDIDKLEQVASSRLNKIIILSSILAIILLCGIIKLYYKIKGK